MKKVIIASVLALTFLIPVSATADTTEQRMEKIQADIKLASLNSKLAKAKSELALAKALQAEKINAKTVKDIAALNLKVTNEYFAMRQQLDALTKLLKTL
jgi:hypothetical protein